VLSDGFQITRRGNTPVRTTIMIDFETYPAKFRLAPALADLLGVVSATRSDAIAGVWHYIKVST
jgi:SWI/SNF-related matrix-associated actin-dependent regulator of chromatin subfamily D